MEKMLVVVFYNEKKAFEGTRALADLDFEGNIAVYAEAVIQKNQDGTVSMKHEEDDFPVRTVGGTAIGIELLCGSHIESHRRRGLPKFPLEFAFHRPLKTQYLRKVL